MTTTEVEVPGMWNGSATTTTSTERYVLQRLDSRVVLTFVAAARSEPYGNTGSHRIHSPESAA